MEGHLEALLEMDFCTKPPNFGVEAHMEAPTGDALNLPPRYFSQQLIPNCNAKSKANWPSFVFKPTGQENGGLVQI
jgi:hypothetical protein